MKWTKRFLDILKRHWKPAAVVSGYLTALIVYWIALDWAALVHMLERQWVHHFPGAPFAYLTAYFVLYATVRKVERLQGLTNPYIVAVVAWFSIFLREPVDAAVGGAWKSYYDWGHWGVFLGLCAWGMTWRLVWAVLHQWGAAEVVRQYLRADELGRREALELLKRRRNGKR